MLGFGGGRSRGLAIPHCGLWSSSRWAETMPACVLDWWSQVSKTEPVFGGSFRELLQDHILNSWFRGGWGAGSRAVPLVVLIPEWVGKGTNRRVLNGLQRMLGFLSIENQGKRPPKSWREVDLIFQKWYRWWEWACKDVELEEEEG